MNPASVVRNFTPSSTEPVSLAEGFPGTVEGGQIVHGQVRGATVTVAPADGVSRLPLSSTARLRKLTLPDLVGTQVNAHDERPLAGCQVAPPSTETSTPATTPPTSLAVPVTVTGVPTCAPVTGLMPEVGGAVSVEAVAASNPACKLPGWSPISAKRFTVACWTLTSGVEEPSS